MTSSSCVCGNIKILGQSVPHFVYPNLPPTENLRLRYIKNLYSVQKHSMEIRDFNEIQSRPLSKLCVHMKCSSCDSSFLFFFWRGYTYYGRIHAVNPKIKPSCLTSQIDRNDQKGCKSLSSRRQVMQQAKKKSDKKVIGSLPNFFRPLILNQRSDDGLQKCHVNRADKFMMKNNIDDESIVSNDADFELMFSNKVDPIVGSYKQDMNIPLDSSFGNAFNCGIQPNSYFA